MSNKVKIKCLTDRHRRLMFQSLNGVRLLAPASFWMASPERRSNVCNGCGPEGWKWFIPDTMYGLCVTDACDIHDWMYCHGMTEQEKRVADFVLKENLYRIIDTKGGMFKKLRHIRAWVYFLAVSWFGEEAFWKGKVHGPDK